MVATVFSANGGGGDSCVPGVCLSAHKSKRLTSLKIVKQIRKETCKIPG